MFRRPKLILKKVLVVFLFAFIQAIVLHGQTGRQVIPFNNDWHFAIDSAKNNWEQVTLPHTYNAIDMQSGKDFYTGNAWYKKSFFISGELKGKRVFLKFGAVGEVATIYINGKLLTEHEGGYSAFAFEISHVIKYGAQNEIWVKVNNDANKKIIPVNHFLFPIYGGIYRPVSMIITNPVNITVTDDASPGIQIEQRSVSSRQATILVKAKLENKVLERRDVITNINIIDAGGKVIHTSSENVIVSPQGTTYVSDTIHITTPHLWNGIKDPYLYKLSVSLNQGAIELDKVDQPLGLRKIEIVAGKGVFLNGVRYPMHGVTRHQDRWQYGNALTPAQEKEDMELIREMGATTIRLAHYQQSEHIYSLADSIGFLIWAEIPFVNSVSMLEGANAKQQMEELVRQNRNHPSIYIWGMHNEVYAKTADDFVPVLTRQLNDIAKTNDPDRYTASVNGYGVMNRPENLNGDVQGMNRYYGWYEGEIADLDKWATDLERKYPDYKVMLTEYGADGNIDQGIDTLVNTKSIDPVNGQFSPESYQTETHIQQWAIIEKHPYILASYLWNMFEFATPLWNRGGVNARNLKGIITFDRTRKKDAFYWYKANWNPEPMVYLANRRDNVRTRQNTTVQVFANIAPVTLKVNGKIISGRRGVNDKHWLFDVVLKKGENKITATAQKDGKKYTDEMVWIF